MNYSWRMKQPLSCPGFGAMARIGLGTIVTLMLYGCAGNQSLLVYRLPYANGTDVCVGRDHLTHTPQQNRLDLGGINGTEPYRVVAAQTGIVRIIVDNLSQNCCANPNCGNNYVWIEHVGTEWTKYSHLATGSVTGDAGLKEGDIVVAGTFLGFESDVGIACSRCGSSEHVHFEVGVPIDPGNPLTSTAPGNGGFINGANRIPRFCGVQGQILVADRDEIAKKCDLLLDCIQSRESPSTEGNCEPGLDDEVCVQEIDTQAENSTYTRGEDFSSSSVKIDLDWCPNSNCDTEVNVGRSIQVVVIPEAENAAHIEFHANCRNRKVLETVHNVRQIIVQRLPSNLEDENTACNGNSALDAFAKWEICEVPPQLAN